MVRRSMAIPWTSDQQPKAISFRPKTVRRGSLLRISQDRVCQLATKRQEIELSMGAGKLQVRSTVSHQAFTWRQSRRTLADLHRQTCKRLVGDGGKQLVLACEVLVQ